MLTIALSAPHQFWMSDHIACKDEPQDSKAGCHAFWSDRSFLSRYHLCLPFLLWIPASSTPPPGQRLSTVSQRTCVVLSFTVASLATYGQPCAQSNLGCVIGTPAGQHRGFATEVVHILVLPSPHPFFCESIPHTIVTHRLSRICHCENSLSVFISV